MEDAGAVLAGAGGRNFGMGWREANVGPRRAGSGRCNGRPAARNIKFPK